MNTLDIPKASQDLQNEVQDFSMPSKKQACSSGSSSSAKAGNKLDDTLSKLMKRKNCVSTFVFLEDFTYILSIIGHIQNWKYFAIFQILVISLLYNVPKIMYTAFGSPKS